MLLDLAYAFRCQKWFKQLLGLQQIAVERSTERGETNVQIIQGIYYTGTTCIANLSMIYKVYRHSTKGSLAQNNWLLITTLFQWSSHLTECTGQQERSAYLFSTWWLSDNFVALCKLMSAILQKYRTTYWSTMPVLFESFLGKVLENIHIKQFLYSSICTLKS